MKKRKKSVLESLAELNNPKPSFEDPEDDGMGMARVINVSEGIYDHPSESDEDDNVLAKLARKRGLRHKTDMEDMGGKYAAQVVNRADLAQNSDEDGNIESDEAEEAYEEETYVAQKKGKKTTKGSMMHFPEEENSAEEEEEEEERETKKKSSLAPTTKTSLKQTKENGSHQNGQKEESKESKKAANKQRRSVMFSNDVTIHEEEEGGNTKGEEDEDEEGEGGAFAGMQDEQHESMLNVLDELEEEDQEQPVFKPSEANEEMKQALAVKKQKAFGDQCMNIRIRLQQPLSIINRFPQGDAFSSAAASPSVAARLTDTQKQIRTILDDLIDLQMAIRQPREEKPVLNTTADIWSFLEKDFMELDKERKTVVELWNNKLQVASGSGPAKTFKVLNQSVNSQIDQALMDEEKLIQRTQIPRSGKRKGEDVKEWNEELYDDTDFYQQLLREVMQGGHEDFSSEIDSDLLKMADVARRKSAKHKVDRRASKGRKVRYTVHGKLAHFMTPIPRPNQDRAETFNELFATLFGKARA